MSGSLVLDGLDLLSAANVTELSFLSGLVASSGASTIEIVWTR